MRLDQKIERMQRPGTTVFTADEAFMAAFQDAVGKLKLAGHAIVVDTTVEGWDRTRADTRVFHYISCKRCSNDAA